MKRAFESTRNPLSPVRAFSLRGEGARNKVEQSPRLERKLESLLDSAGGLGKETAVMAT